MLNSYQDLQSQKRLKMAKNDQKQLFLPILTIFHLKLVWRSWWMLKIVTYSTHSLFGLTCWFEIKIYTAKNDKIFTLSICLTSHYWPVGQPAQVRLAGPHARYPGHLMPGHYVVPFPVKMIRSRPPIKYVRLCFICQTSSCGAPCNLSEKKHPKRFVTKW